MPVNDSLAGLAAHGARLLAPAMTTGDGWPGHFARARLGAWR
jgi:hypothetical protein